MAPPRSAADAGTPPRPAGSCLQPVLMRNPATIISRTCGRAAATLARRARPGWSRVWPAADTRRSPPPAARASLWADTPGPPRAHWCFAPTSSAGLATALRFRLPPWFPLPFPRWAAVLWPPVRPLSRAPGSPAVRGGCPPSWTESCISLPVLWSWRELLSPRPTLSGCSARGGACGPRWRLRLTLCRLGALYTAWAGGLACLSAFTLPAPHLVLWCERRWAWVNLVSIKNWLGAGVGVAIKG